MKLAKAQEQGMQFRVAKFKSYTDTQTGERRQVETQMSVKQWWFTTQAGKLAISLRYGSRVLELAKGKYAVGLAHANDLTKTLDAIKTAVLAGELVAAIDAAATKLRAGFAQLNSTDFGYESIKRSLPIRMYTQMMHTQPSYWVKHSTV